MTIDEFNNFYKQELSEILKAIEDERKRLLCHVIKRIVIVVVAFFLILIIKKLIYNSGILIILFIIGAVSYLYFGCYQRYEDYYKDYKVKIIGSIVKFLDKSLVYDPYYLFPRKDLKKATFSIPL